MRKKKKEWPENAFLDRDTCIYGTFEFQGTVRLEGMVVGNIQSTEGKLFIGQKALIKADISVAEAVINGEVIGTIKASEIITLHSGARITGDLFAKVVKIEKGARFEGNCTVLDDDNIDINSNISEDYSLAEPSS